MSLQTSSLFVCVSHVISENEFSVYDFSILDTGFGTVFEGEIFHFCATNDAYFKQQFENIILKGSRFSWLARTLSVLFTIVWKQHYMLLIFHYVTAEVLLMPNFGGPLKTWNGLIFFLSCLQPFMPQLWECNFQKNCHQWSLRSTKLTMLLRSAALDSS